MSAKPKFSTAPKPPALTAEHAAFIEGGRGKDKPAAKVVAAEPMHRLSLDVPASDAARFKAACAMARTKMTAEILDFIKQRTAELESGKA